MNSPGRIHLQASLIISSRIQLMAYEGHVLNSWHLIQGINSVYTLSVESVCVNKIGFFGLVEHGLFEHPWGEKTSWNTQHGIGTRTTYRNYLVEYHVWVRLLTVLLRVVPDKGVPTRGGCPTQRD